MSQGNRLRLNVGSGQRPFGHPRPTPRHNQACAFCGVPAELHGSAGPAYHPPEFDYPHKYVPSALDAWVNVDIQSKWGADIVADGANMSMFADNSVDMIVSHHVYEHYQLGGADDMVRECHRILKPSGSLIITTPDLTELVVAWREGRLSDYLFCVNLYGAYNGDQADTHKWLTTKKTLSLAVKSTAPWSLVIPFDWREIPGASIAKDFWIQGLEAVK